MAQSVELTFDPASDTALRRQWDLLAEAGLPSSRRPEQSEHHRPHLTLYAAEEISSDAEATLPSLFARLDLRLLVGAPMLFGPRRGTYVLVRHVVVSAELLDLQARTAALCGAHPLGQFGPGRWTPHVTLARRIQAKQVGRALEALADVDQDLQAQIRSCRRWDGDRKIAWWLTG